MTTARWLVVLGWLAAAVAAYLYLPPLGQTADTGGLSSFLPQQSAAIRASKQMSAEFGVPLLPQTALVQRDPEGLPAATQVRAVRAAVALDRRGPTELAGIVAAVPFPNTAGIAPSARERSTTVVTYFAFKPTVSAAGRVRLAHDYARHYFAALPDHGSVVGVTGPTAGRRTQGRLIEGRLDWVELAAILGVVLIVGWEFRSVLAPAVTLVAAAVGYVVDTRLTAWGGQHFGVAVPSELEPLIVVLLLGVVTDYSVFFLNGVRGRLSAGDPPKAAARHAVAATAPWVLGAGLAVAASTAVLVIARLDIFHALGPGMALTVLVGLTVSLTLVPALLTVLGRAAYWPKVPHPASDGDETGSTAPDRGARAVMLRVLTHRFVAAIVVAALSVGLVAAGWQLRHAQLGLSVVTGLPGSAEARQAAVAAGQGFAPGVVSPTVVMVRGDGVTGKRAALTRLEHRIASRPGVAGVLGPRLQPTTSRYGVFLAPDRDAARYVVILDAPPLRYTAIDDVSRLRRELPGLAARAGLGHVETRVAGDTAVAAEIVDITRHDIVRVAVAALVVDLLVLLLFLRSLLASFYLLVADALSLGATLGMTTVVLAQLVHQSQYTFYVPFAVLVLLVAFGSDYEIFLVGRIWDAARDRPLRQAIVDVGPRAARAINVAGLAMAVSFATLALVPLSAFREFALAMVAGVILEVVVIRPILVPALIALFGRAGLWPRHRGRRRAVRSRS